MSYIYVHPTKVQSMKRNVHIGIGGDKAFIYQTHIYTCISKEVNKQKQDDLGDYICNFNHFQAVQKHPSTSVFVNFASFRSVHETTMEAMHHICYMTCSYSPTLT